MHLGLATLKGVCYAEMCNNPVEVVFMDTEPDERNKDTGEICPTGDWIEQLNQIVQKPAGEGLKRLSKGLFTEGFCLFDKFSFPKYVARLYLCYQEAGIQELGRVLQICSRPKHFNAILGTIYFASKKKYFDPKVIPVADNQRLIEPPISDNMANVASEMLFSIVSQSIENPETFERIIQFMYLGGSRINIESPDSNEIQMDFLNILRDSSLMINYSVIHAFENLIGESGQREEIYQKYLSENPILIDPLAKEIIPKQKLGDDYITDFVVRKLNNEHLLVEIEKPSDNIFSKSNDFTSKFTHALGQVIDFQEWVESNIAYAGSKMPGISSPIGILIIGRDRSLNPVQKAKLKRFNTTINGRVKVFTYDDILKNANILYQNIVNR